MAIAAVIPAIAARFLNIGCPSTPESAIPTGFTHATLQSPFGGVLYTTQMPLFRWIGLLVWWAAWAYPFILRAPHRQRRPSITVAGPTRVGLLLECAAIAMALNIRLPDNAPVGLARLIASLICAPIGVVLAWTAVTHLGRQFRIQAGLYEDHELVRTGPYAVVRHPIYASLLAMLLCTLLLLTPWPWALVSLAVFVAGTEIRVHTEDHLLESRFGEAFRDYRRRVPAYVPFVR